MLFLAFFLHETDYICLILDTIREWIFYTNQFENV